MNPVKWLPYTLLLFNLFQFSTSIDTITANRSIGDDELILSGGKVFALGFFSPGNSAKRYLGIWYNQIPEKTIVWVANRKHPISGTTGILSINGQGNLVLYQGSQSTLPVWSTNVSVTSLNDTAAQLLDSGNLVLAQNGSENMLWQSFDYPTDTMLPFMKLGLDRKTGLNRFLSSWKSPDDPGIGNYSYRIDPIGFPQLSLYKGSDKWWRTGSWTGQRWSGVPEMTRNYIFNVSFVDNEDAISIMYGVTDPSILTRMVVNESGMQQRFTWNRRENSWIGFWSAPKEQCDYYNHCGTNSNCNPYHSDVFECTCLPGYEPKFPQEWYLRDGSGGCKRKLGMSTCQNREGFVKVAHVKVPDTLITRVDMSLDLNECELKCLSNCSCIAYTRAYPESNSGIGCLTYHGDLIDTRTYTNAGQDLYVRVNAAELALYAKNGSLRKKEIVAIVISSSVAMLLLVGLVYWFFRRKLKGKSKSGDFKFSYTSSTFLDGSLSGKDQDGNRRNTDLPLFDFSTIAAATNNFCIENKLGEGGFGSVYKGVLPNGREIAIKRLSKYSGQGIREFKNEVSLIAKLQHRNLVSILGCCIEAEEKMLVYEYVPNKSLDFFIFNETKRTLLDWNNRFEIICGIARGILYLHQDSRLRIIHRDLKASNVLLDSALNPKISDFGMARIFGGEQLEGNTNRVVGTYGYMSPEYAMDGQFSIKSDVYSFGVLLVEIITGIKNRGFNLEDCDSSNLVGHVWDLWREGKAMEIVDKSMWEESSHSSVHEVLRCVHVGLLCVQEQASDRPTMSSVVFMLGNDNPLPTPKQPAFIGKIRSNKNGDATWTGTTEGGSSINDVTISMFHGR
ncbi:hypothetical protein Ddye_019501 [Dipteronia dyeriana]|uniref:Receptor-like serine/threonine-protein kinase n=1 Tax=Dipteronia dyeriana TaxID=168575 RepID=A0AAD9TY31_9ROSI|nr:hypothetical protein Ddye_019501 [Dipteronia dyeriana]